MRAHEDRLRRLSINDAQSIGSVLTPAPSDAPMDDLDPHAAALVRLAVLIALDGPAPAFEWATAAAIASGATEDEIVGVLVTAAPLVGSSHVVSAAPRLARAMGYDIDSDLEHLEPRSGGASIAT